MEQNQKRWFSRSVVLLLGLAALVAAAVSLFTNRDETGLALALIVLAAATTGIFGYLGWLGAPFIRVGRSKR
jgi:Na+/melibiose symporter-like transporter